MTIKFIKLIRFDLFKFSAALFILLSLVFATIGLCWFVGLIISSIFDISSVGIKHNFGIGILFLISICAPTFFLGYLLKTYRKFLK